MDKKTLYDTITARKIKPQDFNPYDGNNGRVNKCVNLIKSKKLNRGEKLLDVGGGIGDLGYSVRDLYDETWVLDISEKNLEAAKAKGNKVVQSDVDNVGIDLNDSMFSLVTALDFIEHIIDPEYFARECFRVLKPGGHVFINTPNIRFWQHIKKLWQEGSFPHTSGDREVYHGGHLAFYTFNDLCEIFRGAGFSNFEQIKDEECYQQPPDYWINPLVGAAPGGQERYVRACMELGCPNLLFKCVKPE